MIEQRTIREISGEIWAEINHAHWRDGESVDMHNQKLFLEIAQGVMARYETLQITNDEDFSVDALQKNEIDPEQS